MNARTSGLRVAFGVPEMCAERTSKNIEIPPSRSLLGLEMAASRASGAWRWLLPGPLEPRGGCSQSLEAALKMLVEAVEEPIGEASKLFEVAWLEATSLDAA